MKFFLHYGIWMVMMSTVLAFQYDEYKPQPSPQPMAYSADTYKPGGGFSAPRQYRQMKNDYQPSSFSGAYESNDASYTASVDGSPRNVKVIDVPSTYAMPAESMTIQVPPSSQPLTFVLKSRSSQLNLQPSHESDPGSYQESNSEDGLHVLVHTVTRPVLQEIREVITPYRRVTQEIKPVKETAETLVSRDARTYDNNNYNQPKPKPQPAPYSAPKPQAYKPAPKPQAPQKYARIQQQAYAEPAPKPQAYKPAPQPQAYKPAPKPQAYKPAPQQQAYKPAPQPQAPKPAPQPQAYKPAPQPQAYKPAPQPQAAAPAKNY